MTLINKDQAHDLSVKLSPDACVAVLADELCCYGACMVCVR